jgi:hypothetical protein
VAEMTSDVAGLQNDAVLTILTIREGIDGNLKIDGHRCTYGDCDSQKYIKLSNAIPSEPTNVQLSVVGTVALGLSWTPPAESGGLQVTKYLIEWDTEYTHTRGIAPAYSHVISASETRYKIGETDGHQITKHATYFVRISAFNDLGYGPAAASKMAPHTGSPILPVIYDSCPVCIGTNPTAQIPYMPDNITVDVSAKDIPDQLDVYIYRPTRNVLEFPTNADVDTVDFYRVEYDKIHLRFRS